MKESAEPKLFEDVTLEEPSPSVDYKILAFGHERLLDAKGKGRPANRANVTRRQNALLAFLSTAAALAVVVAILSIARPEILQPFERSSTDAADRLSHDSTSTGPGAAKPGTLGDPLFAGAESAIAMGQLREAVEELRQEVLQIGTEARRIPPERTDERQEIDTRVGICVRDLEALEERVQTRESEFK